MTWSIHSFKQCCYRQPRTCKSCNCWIASVNALWSVCSSESIFNNTISTLLPQVFSLASQDRSTTKRITTMNPRVVVNGDSSCIFNLGAQTPPLHKHFYLDGPSEVSLLFVIAVDGVSSGERAWSFEKEAPTILTFLLWKAGYLWTRLALSAVSGWWCSYDRAVFPVASGNISQARS